MSAVNVITNSVITLYCLSHISHEILKKINSLSGNDYDYFQIAL